MIEKVAPGALDKKKVIKNPKNIFNVIINHNIALDAATKIGCNIVNIGSQDFIDKQEHLILGFIWQILKVPFSTNEYMFTLSGPSPWLE